MVLRFSPIKERHFIDIFECLHGWLINADTRERHGSRKGVSPHQEIGQGSLAKDATGEEMWLGGQKDGSFLLEGGCVAVSSGKRGLGEVVFAGVG